MQLLNKSLFIRFFELISSERNNQITQMLSALSYLKMNRVKRKILTIKLNELFAYYKEPCIVVHM